MQDPKIRYRQVLHVVGKCHFSLEKKKKLLWDKRTDVNYRRLYRLADPVKLTRVQIVQMTEHLNIFSVSVIAFLEAGDLSAH